MIRIILLFNYQQGLTRRQYILPLNRAREFELFQMRSERKRQELTSQPSTSNAEFFDAVPTLPDADEVPEMDEDGDNKTVDQFEIEYNSFKLPSSGRMIRNIEAAPPKSKRMWITPVQTVRLRRLLQVCLLTQGLLVY